MALTPEEIKTALQGKFGTLERAARRMSNEEYEFSASSLSKVINFERDTNIIRVRVARHIGRPVYEVFGNDELSQPMPETPTQAWQSFS